MSRAITIDGRPLEAGVNKDHVDIEAGAAVARELGYTTTKDMMVIVYALQRWQRGEEAGAEATWLRYFPRDLTSWYRIIAAAVETGTEKNRVVYSTARTI
jgi:hypothetical protein